VIGDSCLETKSLDGRHRFIFEDIENPFTHHPSLTSTITMSPSDQASVDFQFLLSASILDLCHGQKRFFSDCNGD